MTNTIKFSCKCGQNEHVEKLINGEKVIICSNCGEEYYTSSSIREIEQSKKEQSAARE